MLWIILIIVLIISLIAVIKAADIFVENLVEIGSSLGISEVILGVTAAAMGTSLPEFGSAIIAILSGNPEIGVGTVLGANIWNMGGILGISAVFSGMITTKKAYLKRDGSMALLTAIILFLFLLYFVNIWAGIVLIVAYLGYLYYLIQGQKKENQKKIESKSTETNPKNLRKKTMWALAGILGLAIGCRILVYCTVELSDIFSIPEMFAGILLAFGTTAPEFFTVFTSARRGLSHLAIGTVLGSNIFNIMIGLGVPALLVTIPVENIAILYDAPVMILMTITLLLLMRRNHRLTRREGLILIVFYAAYITLRMFWTV
ncbi:MAG: calcium/sodium antiporter [Euryarchaeota archaeon]|nr:calcium/sodium antiporter [Euryarchaeota archaeon]MBU4607943.1 calcium/sodium antiporter [Euryarchaeota archaeon]MBV1729238.1 calcium/sodium antiporter [Methanobacterium sp.]MBV1755547.1 calcium/sodium antiporter [Methanobacterium sp.]